MKKRHIKFISTITWIPITLLVMHFYFASVVNDTTPDHGGNGLSCRDELQALRKLNKEEGKAFVFLGNSILWQTDQEKIRHVFSRLFPAAKTIFITCPAHSMSD